ncbi:hypothetical protein JOD54_002804 [Actinokineospora baliensis]|uniref:hypothetical protein n=1 Tax=Actinokineospora baliensis TaxID=547056 RepID=UPI001959FAB9|nr:hypothetical protein [Actinokineospora baliensis]MBM7772600.1 hypothetical protein [Actinokineospora baliensis]
MRKAALRLGFMATATALALGFAAPAASAETTDVPAIVVLNVLNDGDIDITLLDEDLIDDLSDADSVAELQALVALAQEWATDLDITPTQALWLLSEDLLDDGLLDLDIDLDGLGDLLDDLLDGDLLDLDIDLLDDLDLDDVLDIDLLDDLLDDGDLLGGDLLDIDLLADLNIDLGGRHHTTIGTDDSTSTSTTPAVTDTTTTVTDTVADTTDTVTDTLNTVTDNLVNSDTNDSENTNTETR